MSPQMVALNRLIEPAALERAGERKLPILSMTMRSGLIDQASKFKKRVASVDTAEYKLVRRNQLVVGFPIDEGVLSFQDLYDEAIVSPAYDTWRLREDFEVAPTYLERFLRSPRALAFYRVKLRGTTARRRTLPDDVFLKLEVPLPPLLEQRRIAEILDKAEALRATRLAGLAQLDTLAQSIFFEMFGDPATNPKRWPIRHVSDYVAEFQGGRSIEAESSENLVTRNQVLKVSSVTGMTFRADECKPVPDTYAPPIQHFVRPGDLLFSRANTTDLVGAVAYVYRAPQNLLLPDKLWRFVWREPAMVEPLFVWALFQTPTLRRTIEKRATGTSASMKNISQAKVFQISTICPPLAMQKEFTIRLAAIENVRAGLLASCSDFDALFASLQQRAFRGEL